MGALIVGLAVAALLIWVAHPARRRDTARTADTARSDAPSRLLHWAVGALPTDRAPWGDAMFGELDRIDNRGRRWRVAIGCASAAVVLQSRRADAARLTSRLAAATGPAGAGRV